MPPRRSSLQRSFFALFKRDNFPPIFLRNSRVSTKYYVKAARRGQKRGDGKCLFSRLSRTATVPFPSFPAAVAAALPGVPFTSSFFVEVEGRERSVGDRCERGTQRRRGLWCLGCVCTHSQSHMGAQEERINLGNSTVKKLSSHNITKQCMH